MDLGASVAAVFAPIVIVAGRETARAFVGRAGDLMLDGANIVARPVYQADHNGCTEKELLEHDAVFCAIRP